ncbi:hypothetical protein ASD38_21840 [Caulobacter sp. Root487D2Y]|uniref:hypothetical protein n=1 Tax=Caulobacter sp. Root487D2Y TaxID=1736547 RepID=UPI0006F8A7A9|nr:hypothetical protein [Caulobacter sp. Root487D2Y]KQY34383.1 hypothetical protein ASD38_21840 [Caulobacter sp. Root487D2Y]
MADFAFGQAALAPLALLRRRPLATVGLALTGVLISLAGRLASIVANHFALFGGGPPLATPLLAGLGALLATGVVVSIVGAAVARAIGADATGGGLVRLGGDEARLFVLWLLIVPALLMVLVVMFVGAGIGAAIHAAGPKLNVLMWSAMAIGALGVFGPVSRLWPAGAMVVRDGRIGLRRAWRLTAPHPWKVYGVYVAAMAAALLVGVGANIVLNRVTQDLPLFTWRSYGAWSAVLKSGFAPVQLAFLLLQGLLFGLAVILQAAPGAAIYQALAGDRAREQAAAFD